MADSSEGAKTAGGYDYDLVVIGGGSGGLSCAKAAAEAGAKVACLDFVQPSPQGSTWGLGGTCVNVGCIPKKLFHTAAIHGHNLHDAREYGWEVAEALPPHGWMKLVTAIQDHIGSLNWGYRVQLRDKEVQYLNAYGSLTDAHTIKTVNKRGKETIITTDKVVLAMGGRPRYPDIPGAKEFCISSDDLFSLPHAPGKTLVVGASYVALECAGFLSGLGYDTTVMVRSILLRGFDQQMADKIGAYMEQHKTKFIRSAVPTKVEKLEDGKLRVTYQGSDGGAEQSDTFDTVLFAVGRDPCTSGIGLVEAGVKLAKNGKVIVDDHERTSVDNIFAIGDIAEGKLELTPVAIQAGKLLAERLFAGGKRLTDYINVPTTVFTPLEYGCIGYAEEAAEEKFGKDNVEVYHQAFTPLEMTVAHRDENASYAKLVCNKADNMRVVGLHIVGPNAGEVTQGFGIAFKMKATKADFDDLIGIHPTVAEVFTTLDISKSSGVDPSAKGC